MNWTAFLLMLPHLKPKCLDILSPGLYRGLDVLRVLSLAAICILFLRAYLKEKRYPSLPSVLLGVLEGWICLVTMITGGDYVETFSLAVSVMAIVLLVDLYANHMKELLTALMLNYEWMVYVNLYTVWKYGGEGFVQDPDYGNIAIYFFGPDNWFMYLCIPAVCVALLYLRVRCRDKLAALHILRAVGLTAAVYATILLSKPTTALAAMGVMLVVLVIGMVPLIRYCVSFPVVLTGGATGHVLLASYRIVENYKPLAQFIRKNFDKTANLSGRTAIWDWFLERFSENPWLGIGNPVEGYPVGKSSFDHIHNQYFDILALGGIPALAIFVAALLLVGWMLTKRCKTYAARIITACMAGFLVMCVTEVCRHGSIFLLFPLAWHVSKIEETHL